MHRPKILILLLVSTTVPVQIIQNADSETPRDSIRTLPTGWRVDRKAGYTVALDSTVAKKGRRSLQIAYVPDAAVSQPFSQSAPVRSSAPALVHLRGFVKTDHPAGVGVWWNSWRDWKHRGFAHSSQQVSLRPTDAWQPLDLVLPTSADITQFTFGAYLRGQGHAWFDDLRFEAAPVGAGEPSAQVNAYVQEAIALVRKHALVRDSVPWPQAQAEVLAFARGMQTAEQAYPVIGHRLDVLRRYGDNHSPFQSPATVKNPRADQPDDEGPQPQARYLGDGVGYVAVPRFWGINETREMVFATKIQTLIRRVDSAQIVTDWVVDLRENGDGNRFPMITGLGPLLGEGALGYFVDGNREVPREDRNGKSYVKKTGTNVSVPYRLRQAGARVAVLIGPRTGSSEETTVIPFVGRSSARLFGLPSAGYTTANDNFKLPEGAQLYLATAVTADRTHKTYPQRIIPDEEIKAPATDTADLALDAAKAWLTEP